MLVKSSAVLFLTIKSALKSSTTSMSITSSKIPPLSSIRSMIKLNGNSSGKLLILIKTASPYFTSLNEFLRSVIVSFIFVFKKNLDFKA